MTDVANQHNEVGPRSKRIVEQEQRHMAPGLQSFALYSGLAMARGVGSRLYDEDGNGYIDFIAGIAVGSVGHCHPHYVETLKAQAERLTFGSFTTETRAKFLDLLASVTPPGLTRIQLFSSGAEAVEAAFRLAKSATKKFEFVGYSGAFHGKTGGVLPLLWGDFKDGMGPFTPGCYVAPYASCYRCLLSLTYPGCGVACADKTREVIRNQTGGAVAAVIAEPMQGTAGNVIPPPGFLSAIRGIAKEHGALFIADEMITGFGRTGKMWGVDHDGVVPDVITLGKGVGGQAREAGDWHEEVVRVGLRQDLIRLPQERPTSVEWTVGRRHPEIVGRSRSDRIRWKTRSGGRHWASDSHSVVVRTAVLDYAAWRMSRWCRPPTSGTWTILPASERSTGLTSGASLSSARCVRARW